MGIQSIFNKIGCNTPANMEMLGNEGVTEANMMQYLGIIEQRTNEILQLYASTQAREGIVDATGNPVPSVSSILGQGPQQAAGRNTISIQPPTTTEEAFDSDEDSEARTCIPICLHPYQSYISPPLSLSYLCIAASQDDDEDRPFSRDELKAKTMRGLHKREAKDKKKEGKRGGKEKRGGRAA